MEKISKQDIPLVSIIVPVYNAEKYLPRCINSILSQTIQDFELLLINDGSLDNSYAICEQYASKDGRIHVFSKGNGGVSSARNIGLKEAKGEWIAFVDSDDELLSNFLEHLLTYNNKEINIVVGNCIVIENSVRIKNHVELEQSIMTCQQFLERLLCGINVRNEVWGKLFRKSFINDLIFNENIKIGEDLLFLMYCCYKNPFNKVAILPSAEYIYYQVPGSAMSNSKDLTLEYEKLIDKVFDIFLGKINKSILSRFAMNQYWVIFNRYKLKKWKFPNKYDKKIEVEFSSVLNRNKHDKILYVYSQNHLLGFILYLLSKIYDKLK